ncbi:MAG TPA: low affinity iron permease family protein [Hyphomicrobiaceae bacterium]|nr:low affinity iron permease family protein [Hyphomicrobiaceae bacterium]
MRQQPDASHRGIFTALARYASHAFGSPWAFAAACGLVLGWALAGPFFAYSDAWQLVINTGTTIATFLMVFLLQHTQNRDAQALHLKLDEMIRSTRSARNRLIDLEDCTEQELDDFQREFERVRRDSGPNSAPRPEPPPAGGHQPPG